MTNLPAAGKSYLALVAVRDLNKFLFVSKYAILTIIVIFVRKVLIAF